MSLLLESLKPAITVGGEGSYSETSIMVFLIRGIRNNYLKANDLHNGSQAPCTCCNSEGQHSHQIKIETLVGRAESSVTNFLQPESSGQGGKTQAHLSINEGVIRRALS